MASGLPLREKILEEFYEAIASGDPSRARRVHIPRSDVFYIRRAYYEATGNWETLDRIERAMYLEGHLLKQDVFEPEVIRDWEEDYNQYSEDYEGVPSWESQQREA